MISLSDKKTQIDDILDKMAENLQLGDSRYDRMKQHYEAVKNWIEKDEKFFKPFAYEVYPHGSVRILTTVKPIGKDEFDLDIALHLKTSHISHTPQKIYIELKRRLMEHEKYKEILEAKNRCLRLKYHGDFHMDILPGIQEFDWDDDRLCIPDRSLGLWVSSNPRGYAKWFLDKANSVKTSLLEKALQAENIPADNFRYKKPLQRAVQLIKRYRDVYFQKDATYKTSSIILTTIAGQYYDGEDSIFDTVEGIVNRMSENIQYLPDRIKILNPVNQQEDFTDKWDKEPAFYEAFKNFLHHLYNEWQELKKEHGVLQEGQILKGLFGSDLFINAQRSQVEQLEDFRRQKAIGISRGSGNIVQVGTSSSTLIKNNTFYGY
ncbi:nucleotidyltransferase [Olivibacter sp. SDN3]|uniref:Nucleotidyltransferase n=1 Tax=Olivibacter jilunii TaxID=985016 RepID=A0ABW6B1U5_9SPHI|nr:nucleotidyltransferase [Olivibacter sp. SDN3]MDX3917222.1 nucleotidyltransferase [Pseudosphingobacterium sp.]QNL50248.1 nucleotidyltransferase [Olivibacter sp. SDN3]